ncbi:MAG: flagellar basal body rod protein FlgB [Clostridiales bacterium]|nr:flagellar basal body rod protein FlgB [Clostridiales bacterium]
MFYNSSSFKALEAGVQLSWLQQQINTQNLANIETPNYKAKSLSFDAVLSEVQNTNGNPEIKRIDASINTSDAISKRGDGNNVDLDAEQLSLYKSYVNYTMLLDKIKNQFDNYNSVLGANM